MDAVALTMNTSPFDPRVKRTHSRLQAMILVAARYPLSAQTEQEMHLEEDALNADAMDAVIVDKDEDYDIWEEEGFSVKDDIIHGIPHNL